MGRKIHHSGSGSENSIVGLTQLDAVRGVSEARDQNVCLYIAGEKRTLGASQDSERFRLRNAKSVPFP